MHTTPARGWRLRNRVFGVVIGAMGLAGPAIADPVPGGGVLASCTLPDVARAARCSTIHVPENRDAPHRRTLALRVAVVPAAKTRARKDPIVILQGGPGESAVDDASVYVSRLEPLLDDRDLLLVDQRGAGGSAALTCELAERNDPAPLFKDIFPPDAVERCASTLATQADLTQYGYTSFADDLDEVRRALGYRTLNLFASSYGTRAAQVYLRRFPARVRTVYLGSVVPIDIATPQTMAHTAQVEMERLFEACAGDPACRDAHPRLRAEFGEVMGRLTRGEASASMAGRDQPVVLHAGPAAAWMRAKLYRPSSAAMLPWVIHRAHEGDWKPLAEGVAATAGTGSTFSYGLFFAITCNEDVRFMEPAAIEQGARGSFLGEARARQQQAACRFWPESPLPPGYRAPVRSDVPTLFVTGESDGGTPVWFTEHAAKHFSKHAIVFAPGQGHTEWSPCIAARYVDLVRRGQAGQPQRQTCPVVPRPPFKT